MRLLHILFGAKDEFNRPVDNEYFFDQMEKAVADIAEGPKGFGISANGPYDGGKEILFGTNIDNAVPAALFSGVRLSIHRKTFSQSLGKQVGHINIYAPTDTQGPRSALYDRYGLLESSRDKFDWSLFDFYMTAIDPNYID